MKITALVAGVLWMLAVTGPAWGRGRGTQGYLISHEGRIVTTLGDTTADLVDPVAEVIFRYREGRITAAPLDRPELPQWTTAARPQIDGRRPRWRLLPELVVVIGEDSITGIHRGDGKIAYSTATGNFTRNSDPSLYCFHSASPAEHALYLVRDADELAATSGAVRTPPMLAKFDLTNGGFLWTAPIVAPSGNHASPTRIDPRGIIAGRRDDEAWYFDPATGKSLLKAPEASRVSAPPAGPTVRVQTTRDAVVVRDSEGRTVWTRAEPGEKGAAVITDDSVIVPQVHDDHQARVIAWNIKDGVERWRCTLPFDRFADEVHVEVEATKRGFFVQLFWTVLD